MGNESSKSHQSASTKKSSSGILSTLKPGPSNAVIQQHLNTAKKTRVLSLKASNLKLIPSNLIEVSWISI